MQRNVRRRLVGLPVGDGPTAFDARLTGSAAIECAFVASGLLAAAGFAAPNLWDVAGGAALVLASGGEVRVQQSDGWAPLDRFEAAGGDLARWSVPMALGEPALVGEGQPSRGAF